MSISDTGPTEPVGIMLLGMPFSFTPATYLKNVRKMLRKRNKERKLNYEFREKRKK